MNPTSTASRWLRLSWLPLIGALAAPAEATVAVLDEPGMVYFMADSSLHPRDAVEALRACGLEADALNAAQLADAAVFNADRYAALLTVYGNTFPKSIAPHVERFHREGGGLIHFGVPYCHPCVPQALAGWMVYAPPEVAQDDAVFRSPPYSARIRARNIEGAWAGMTSGRVTVEPGQTLHVSAQVLATEAVGGNTAVLARFFRADGTFIEQTGPTVAGGTEGWHELAGRAEAPEDAASADLCVALFGSGELWVDDLSLRRTADGPGLLANPDLDQVLPGAPYTDLGHFGDWLGHDALGIGGFAIVPWADDVAVDGSLAELRFDPAALSRQQNMCVMDATPLPADDELIGLVAAMAEGERVGWTSGLVRHGCEGFAGVVDGWVSTVSPQRPLADRLLVAVTARALTEAGRLEAPVAEEAVRLADAYVPPEPELVELPPAGEGWEGMFPKPSSPSRRLIAVSLSGLPPDDQLTLTALQGLANAGFRPKVYIADEWVPDLEERRYRFENLDDPFELLARFADMVNGLVVYDPALPATANLALTLCGLEGWLPVSPAQVGTAPYAGLTVREDLRGRFATEAEAYEWALAELRPRCTDRVLCHEKQMEPLRPAAAEIAAKIADYIVQHRIFSFHLNRAPTRADIDVARKILATYPLNTPIIGHFGPEANGAPNLANEAEIVELASKYGKCFVFLVSNNVSIHAGFTTPELAQRHPEPPVFDSYAVYVAPYLSDGDSPTTFYQGRERWRDPARGKVPIAWSLGPASLELYPVPMEWFYKNATEMDTFVCACSGAAYCYPRVYGELTTIGHEAALDSFLELTDRMMRLADLDICHVHHVAGLGPEELDRFADKVTYLCGILADYSRVVEGYGVSHGLAGGRVPVFHALTSFSRPAEGSFGELWSREIEAVTPEDERPAFVHFFGVLWFATPTDILETRRELSTATYVFVRPDEMTDMYLGAVRRGYEPWD